MGTFVAREIDASGRVRRVVEVDNLLHDEGAEVLLRRVFPPLGDTPAFQIGLTGAMLTSRTDRPNPDGYPATPVEYNAATTLEDVAGWNANEGGQIDDLVRNVIGYARRDVEFTVAAEADGAGFRTETMTFINAVTWEQHGDWGEGVDPPWPFKKGWNWQPDVGYPWQVPNVHSDYLLGVDAYGEFLANNLHRLGGYPIIAAFIVETGANKLIASCRFRSPLLLRPGGSIEVQYSGRIHDQRMTAAFALAFTQAALGGDYPPNAWSVRLCTNPAGSLGARSTVAQLTSPPGCDPLPLGAEWEFVAATGGDPPHVRAYGVPRWENETEETWLIRYIAIVAGEVLCWFIELDVEGVAIPVGDAAEISDGVKFSLVNRP